MKPAGVISRLLLLAQVFLCACGSPPEQTGTGPAVGARAAFDVVKVDSIGLELGDTSYVFGTVIDATVLPGGRIALLDLMKKRVSVFSPEGVFLGSAGRDGSGPGEFVMPKAIAPLPDGGFAVADVQLGKISFFDDSLVLSRELTGFQPMTPHVIHEGPGGSILGMRMNYYYDDDEEEVYSGSEYAVWSNSIEADRIYIEEYHPHASEEPLPYYSFCAAPDGRLFFALSSHDEYRIIAFDSVGGEVCRIEEPWDPRPITEEELQAARPHIVVPGPGSESTVTELSSDWEPDTLRYAARVLGTDDLGRLWVKSGFGDSASQVFDLYDTADGRLLMRVRSSLPPISRYWAYSVTPEGIVAWDHNPSDYPRVYVLELVEYCDDP